VYAGRRDIESVYMLEIWHQNCVICVYLCTIHHDLKNNYVATIFGKVALRGVWCVSVCVCACVCIYMYMYIFIFIFTHTPGAVTLSLDGRWQFRFKNVKLVCILLIIDQNTNAELCLGVFSRAVVNVNARECAYIYMYVF